MGIKLPAVSLAVAAFAATAAADARIVGRAAFVRGETNATVTVERLDGATGAAERRTVPVETRLRPGWKSLSVKFGDSVETVRYGIGPQTPERMPLVIQDSNRDVAGPADIGFTCGQYGDGKVCFAVTDVPDADNRYLPGVIRSLDEAIVNGIGFSLASKRPVLIPPGIPAAEFRRLDIGGGTIFEDEKGKRPSLECGDPRILGYTRECWEKWGEILGPHPAFAMALPYSETRDRSRPSWNGDAKRYLAETGREMPREFTSGRTIDNAAMRRAHPDGLVDDDDPLLAFYRWYWSGGDGCPRWVSAASDGLRAGVAKSAPGKAFDTFWDPSVRCPPRWGSGGSATCLGQWVYANPEPMAVAGPAEEVLAMAKGRGQRAFVHTQMMCYRARLAPKEQKVANPPAWCGWLPDAARTIAVPADLFTEATWSMLAKPMDGYSFYPWSSVCGTGSVYHATEPRLHSAVRHMLRDVIGPLGPFLKRLGRAEPDVAVFENFTSVVMGEPFGMGWHSAPLSFLQRARLDPKVVYEETIERDGFGGIKVLFAPGCGFVTRSMAERLKAFRAAGGILVADGRLAKAVEADITVDEQRFPAPPRYDYAEYVEEQGGVEAAVGANREKTVSAKRRMCDAAEKLRLALAGRYAARSDSSSPELPVYNRRWRDVDYLFAVNDARVFGDYTGQWGLAQEKGAPLSGWVEADGGNVAAVYELSRGARCAFERRGGKVRVPVEFDTNDGRIFAFLPREIASVRAVARRSGDRIGVGMSVEDADGRPVRALLPVEMRVYAPDGDEVDGGGYFAAEGGVAKMRVTVRLDDPEGAYRVVCRDRASGLSKELFVR